ncbi:MAG: DNA adenine methylase [Magnetospirillum sp. WYHS-4]
MTKESIPSAKPPAAWLGGKRNLARRIVARIEAIPHSTYAEPFLGMGGVFFRRRQAPEAEVVNDLNRDVANLFRILQRHFPQFMDTLRFQLTTRTDFNRLVATSPETLTDLERAARFLYLQRTAFGGKVSGRNFGVSPGNGARFNLVTLERDLQDVHERLAGVVIECLPYDRFISRYDRAETLFYLDPPYWGCEADYGRGLFCRDDFAALAEQLAGIKGRFILSLNDTPGVRETFERFRIEAVETTYTVARGDRPQTAREVLIVGPR